MGMMTSDLLKDELLNDEKDKRKKRRNVLEDSIATMKHLFIQVMDCLMLTTFRTYSLSLRYEDIRDHLSHFSAWKCVQGCEASECGRPLPQQRPPGATLKRRLRSTNPATTNPGGGSPPPGLGSGTVYIDPSVYGQSSPSVACVPPCTLIMPPVQLKTTTTIIFPPYTTSLDVAWMTTVSSSVFVTRTIQTTTLTIPPGSKCPSKMTCSSS